MNSYTNHPSPTNLVPSDDSEKVEGTQNVAYGIPGDDSSPFRYGSVESNGNIQAGVDDSPTTTFEINGNVRAGVDDTQLATVATKVYFRRWFALGLFVLLSMSNAFQWIEYSIIANVIESYYNVDYNAVNWTSMVYMVAYIPLIFPGSWLLDKKGLRLTILLGAFGTALGAWIKCASVSTDRFYVTMIGQTICAISQVFILGIPPRLAAVWFGPQQVSTACAIGVFGNQLGVALGFLLPPIMVPASDDENVVENGMKILFYSVAAVSTVLLALVIFFFKSEPPCPPSLAAASAADESSNGQFLKSIYRLIKNRSYLLLLLSYGINAGVFYAISTLLNQVFLSHFEGQEKNAGLIGLTIVVCGMLGSVVGGIVLDKTHRFKETTLSIYMFSFLGMVAYAFNFKADLIWVVFLVAGILGFFMTGYLPVGFEFAAEITYPESEGTSSGLLNASAQIFGIIFTLGAGWLLNDYNDVASNLALAGMLLIGVLMTAFVKSDLKRQAAQCEHSLSVLDQKSSKMTNGCNVV